MSNVWDTETPPAFTVQRITEDGAGGDFVRGMPATRQNALRYHAKSITTNTASDKIAVKSSMTAVPVDYGVVELSWAWPDAYSAWEEVAIVRSGMGHPSTVNDGVVIFRTTQADYEFYDDDGNPLTITIEDPVLQPGRWYYYTLFFHTTVWEPVMYTEALTPRNFSHADHLWDSIPEYYRWVDSRFRGEQGHLHQFLHMFGFELDLTREYVESWQDVYHFDNSPWPLLYQVGLNLGIGKDDGLGEIRTRSLISQINTLYDQRGTSAGIVGLVQASSKYETTVTSGRNLLLLPDDSEFITGHGNWLLSEVGYAVPVYEWVGEGLGRAFNASVTATHATFTVSNKALTSGVATLTTTASHGFSAGNTIVVEGVDAVFNGTYTVVGTPAANTVTYAVSASNVVSVATTGSVYAERNALGTRTADIGGARGHAYGAYLSTSAADWNRVTGSTWIPSHNVVFQVLSTVATATSGITTSDYAPDSGHNVLNVLVADDYGTDAVTLTCGLGTNEVGTELTPQNNGVPVEPNMRYGFTCQFKALNTHASAVVGILWYDRDQLLLADDFTNVPVTGGWQELVVYGLTEPTALYGIPYISMLNRNNGDDFKVMGCMFYEAGDAGTATPLAPDYYLTLGTDELIGVASGKVIGG
jgi:phage tail-like protein